MTTDGTRVDLRCSAIVSRGSDVLLIRRGADWVLPGGRPSEGETLQSCARREVLEETGLHVTATKCAFVAEVIPPNRSSRVVDVIFRAERISDKGTLTGEAGADPRWVPLDELSRITIHPPVNGYIPAVLHGSREQVSYLGNLWRSTP